MTRRIDVHTHIMPPFWREGMQNPMHNPNRYPTPPWTPDSALAYMDDQKIEAGILSLTTPGIAKWAPDERPDAARRVNDYNAGLCVKHPGRFGTFATLPLPDVEASLRYLPHVLDDLKADGVILFSNYDGMYLGNPVFEPLWAELDAREAVAFVHPGMLALPELPGTPAAFCDFPFDTTRSATDIVLKGVFDRHQKVKVILSHGGGFLPFAAYRIAGCASMMPGAQPIDFYLAAFRRFYFDIALTGSPTALPSLLAFADPSRVLFGTDYPYAPGNLSQSFTAMYEANPMVTAEQRAAIDRDNATALLPQWKS